jgi:hypothetical protein
VSRWGPADVAEDLASWWVVALTWAGGVVYLGDGHIDIESADGPIQVFGGLASVSWTDELALPLGEGVDAEPQGVEIDATFPPGLNVPELVEAGHALDDCPVEVSIVTEGQTWEQRRVVLVGRVLDPRYGHAEEPVSFSADASILRAGATIPGPTRAVSSGTWSGPPADSEGRSYPIILGRPGDCDGRKAAGSTATVVDDATRKAVIADGWCEAATVAIRDDDFEGGQWQTVGVSHELDLDGQPVSTIILPEGLRGTGYLEVVAATGATDTITIGGLVGTGVAGPRAAGTNTWSTDTASALNHATSVDDMLDDATNQFLAVVTAFRNGTRIALTAANPGSEELAIERTHASTGIIMADSGSVSGGTDEWDLEHTISVSWSTAAGSRGGQARARAPGGSLATAGEILEWMLQRVDVTRVDAGRTRVAADLLSQVRIDAAIEEAVEPLEWVRAHLLPILPISMVAGPSGLYPVVLRWWATARDAVADIDLDRDLGDLVSGVEAAGDVASEIDISFARDIGRDEFRRRVVLTGDPAALRTPGDELRASVYTRAAHQRYGRVVRALDSDVLYDIASAWRVSEWIAMGLWTRHRTLSVALPRSVAGWLAPGDIVTFSYSGLSMSQKPAIVRSISGLTEPAVTVGLTLVEHPRGVAGSLV